ncbi:uncharacterized protein LOC113862498 [Abrus precatorius]|uniref:Uncharacterized protein LOC113862498 n=1 Tax=Abrus precatorius TaxID=3816 RepID=A0A8B8L7Q8_ABRPR|nr:uncharacterized protein LOC113862498 [Abrus precatorius]
MRLVMQGVFGVYGILIAGSPQALSRRDLWYNLKNIAQSVSSQPWCLVGDFNATLNSWDHKGRSRDTQNLVCPLFQAFMRDCNLVDAGFVGSLLPGNVDLPNVVRNLWNEASPWNTNLTTLQDGLRDWNQNVFGNIFKRKKEIMKWLDGISRSLSHGPNVYLEGLQQRLWKDYEKILLREELLWFQKSRCKWLQFGDKNSKYFHGTTIVRRKKNKIESLQADDGSLIIDGYALEHHALNYLQGRRSSN